MSRVARWLAAPVAALALLVSVLPVAHAGSADAPEITDPTGDAALCIQSPACVPSQDALDITAAWVSETADGKVVLSLAVAGAPPVSGAGAGANVPAPLGFCAQAAAYFEYDLNFKTTDASGAPLVPKDASGNTLTALYVRAILHCDTPSGASDPTGFEFDLAYTFDSATGSNIVVIPVTGALTGNVFSWTLDRADPLLQVPAGSAAAGDKIDGLSAVSGMAGAGIAFSLNTIVADSAPDTGTGTPYVFGGAAPSAVYTNVTTPAFDVVAKNPAPNNGTYVYNWTASGSDLALTYALASGSGTAHVTVRDAGNATAFNQTLSDHQNGTVSLANAKLGPWQVTVAYTNFTGDLTLGIAPSQSSSSSMAPTGTSSSSSAAASSSAGSTSGGFPLRHTDKGTPAPSMPLVALSLAACAAVLAARRRLPPA